MNLSIAFVLSLVVSVIIPLVSALFTRAKWSSEVTGIISLFLSAIAGLAVEWSQATDLSHFNLKAAALNAVVSYVVAVAAHYGAWKSGSIEASLHAFPSQPAALPTAA